MKPIAFVCEAMLVQSPEAISEGILDLSRWPEFPGYGPIPGIKSAEFETRTPNVVGTRIRVRNTDGSSHIEEIIEWQPDRRVAIHMKDFAAPLSRLATRIVETWEFSRTGSETKVARTFEMHAKSVWAWPVLWLISFLLKGAVTRHMQIMRGKAG